MAGAGAEGLAAMATLMSSRQRVGQNSELRATADSNSLGVSGVLGRKESRVVQLNSQRWCCLLRLPLAVCEGNFQLYEQAKVRLNNADVKCQNQEKRENIDKYFPFSLFLAFDISIIQITAKKQRMSSHTEQA